MELEIIIEQNIDGYSALIIYMGDENSADKIETNSAEDMRNALLFSYGVECIYNEVTGELKACTQG